MTKDKRNRIGKTGAWILAAVCLGASLMGCSAKEKNKTDSKAVTVSSESESQETTEEKKQSRKDEPDSNGSDTDTPEPLDTMKVEPVQEKSGQEEQEEQKEQTDKTEPAATTVPEKPETPAEQSETAAADIRDYLEDIFGFIDALGLEETEAESLERCFRKGSMKVDLTVFENEVSYSVSDDCAGGASVYGADVGMTPEEAAYQMKLYGWRKWSDEVFVSVINGRRYYLSFHTEEQDTIQNWYLCNWPEGENIDELYEGLEPEENSEEEQTGDICDYIWDIRGMIRVLELQEKEPRGLEAYYEKNGIELDFSEMGYSFTLENNGEDTLTVYGVKIGDSAEETKRKMEEAGWVKAEGFESEYINVMGDRLFNCSFYTDEQGAVTGWWFCNWPEGDGELMMQLAELERERKGQ